MKSHRRIEFDILKGLLIILVVAGHALPSTSFVDRVIYWFHMPCFFMVSGYFMKQSHNNPFMDRDYLIHQVRRCIVPFFVWCFCLYLIFRPENPLKNLIRVLYAGHNNITIYSFPFWFINALFVSSIMLSFAEYVTKRNKWCMGGGALALWIICHTLLPLSCPLPWSIDQSVGAICFLWIGTLFRKMDYKFFYWHLIFPLIAILFLFYNINNGMFYHLNMSAMQYDYFFLDIFVPCLFSFSLLLLSLALCRTKILAWALSHIGMASITIFFAHAALLYLQKNLGVNIYVQVFLAVILGMLIHRFFKQFKYTRMLFLGK